MLVTPSVTIGSAKSGSAESDAATQLRLPVETFEFDQLIRDVCDSLNLVANAKGLSIEIELAHSPMTVSAEPIRIAQVLRTLVEIAVRCTHSGHVLVAVEEFDRRWGETQDEIPACDASRGEVHVVLTRKRLVRFSVHHSGPCLPLSTSASVRGTALPFAMNTHTLERDLALIRHMLEQLGGTILVDTREASNPRGQGTTFTVSIPVYQVEDAQACSDGAQDVDLLHVLVVDELSDVGRSIADAVVRLGHCCSSVSTAGEARALLASTQFDAILMDMEMTNTGGLSLAVEIRQELGPNGASMLILTGLAEAQPLSHAWPFDGFLEKPITDEALIRLIGSRM